MTLVLSGCFDCDGDDDESGNDNGIGNTSALASVHLSPKVVPLPVGGTADLSSTLEWTLSGDSVSIASVASGVVNDLTGSFELAGGSGESDEVHRISCQRAGVGTLKIQILSPSDGAALVEDTALVFCKETIPDVMNDHFYSISDVVATYTPAFTDIVATGSAIVELTQKDVDRLNRPEIDLPLPDMTLSLRDEGGPLMDAGDAVIITTVVAAPIPVAEPTHSLSYSVVFETDGNTVNDWAFQSDFDWDQFQGADTFYQALWDHRTQTWRVARTVVGDDQMQRTEPTAARFMVLGDKAYWLIPKSELGDGDPVFRDATFGHDGLFSQDESGGDVTGANPTQPLLPLGPRLEF